ncbi:D-alanyl-D-alanine carboxypeptidase family protein [Candidatus Saccharibacteria bacterium]|nr:D-alanyl-D-alanine carboxypeptidase family protein [Candidatus Saccharibacteria bacterium]
MRKNRLLSIVLCLALLCCFLSPLDALANDAPSSEPDGHVKSVYTIKMDSLDEVMNPNRDYLLLVNSTHKYEFGGYYDINIQKDLIYCANDVDGDTMAAEKAAYLAYTMLKRDLELSDGIKLGIYDGYRTAADQEYLIKLLRTPDNPVADVGYSEAHTGLLLTMVIWDRSSGTWASSLDAEQVRKDFATMHKKAADYGFIVRYPEGKESITGVHYWPSNMRFVGSPAVAHRIMDNGLTLEEFLDEIKNPTRSKSK